MRIDLTIHSRFIPFGEAVLVRVVPGSDARWHPCMPRSRWCSFERCRANILPTDFDRQTPADAALGPCSAVKAQVSGLRRGSGRSLKVATRVRIPLGLLPNPWSEVVVGGSETFW